MSNEMPEHKRRVAILISGRGSNMRALIDAAQQSDFPAEIVGVISNRPKAKGLEYAADKGIATFVVDHKLFDSRSSFEEELQKVLTGLDTEFVCNAGFMRLLTEPFVEAWRDRQMNIHPSLLPSYKGLHTHRRVLEDGGCITGCTVHFVRFEMDEGPIVAQAAVPVLPEDDEETLAARVLEAEHKLYPFALAMVASGQAEVVGNRVEYSALPDKEIETLFSPIP